jgi:hypothetical protein
MKFGFLKWVTYLLILCGGCASADDLEGDARSVREFVVTVDRDVVVPSSTLNFQVLNSADRAASGAQVRFAGVLEGGESIDESFYVGVDRIGEKGDLVVQVRVFEGLFAAVSPQGSRRFTGTVAIELDDALGTFGQAYLEDTRLLFVAELEPIITGIEVPASAHVFDDIDVSGSGILMPDEGTTWAVLDSGEIIHEDGSVRQITNARIAVRWTGTRGSGDLKISPEIFGVRVGRFRGSLRFENQLRTGELFLGTSGVPVDVTIQRSRIDNLDPPAGSRGQRIQINGEGFLPDNKDRGYGMYLRFEGTFVPTNLEISPRTYEGTSAVIRAPYRVVDGTHIDQPVWADVTPNGQLTGLGATPGRFSGRITPVLYDVTGEEDGEEWTGIFDVLPTRQIVFVRFLPGFSRALQNYGLANVETEIRARVLFVLSRDYAGVNVGFVDKTPSDFLEFTTIEIGGPDPSGLLNFGYDNSFNDGGKDLGNLYLSDYLGGVNVHSQEAGYLPYGGVFIESFVAFSPGLFPQNFGTSPSFDRIMNPVMPALGGAPVSGEEWPEGPRQTAIEAAINLIGTLAGHTASHEIGHSFGLAFFPESVDGYAERFHNDPPGNNWLMDAGSDRPFEERAEIDGMGPAGFNSSNKAYLERILPSP